MWVEQEGLFGNSERRTQHFDRIVPGPGDTMSDTWQIIEVARRLGFQKQFSWGEDEYIERIWEDPPNV